MKSEFCIHRAFLLAVFLLSAFLISFPQSEKMGILPIMFAFALVLILYFLVLKFKENTLLKRLIALVAALLAIFQISEISSFFKKTSLNNTPKFLILAAFLVCVSVVAVLGEIPILKFSLCFFSIAFLIVALVFVLSAKGFQAMPLKEILLPDRNEFWISALESFLRFIPISAVAVLDTAERNKTRDLMGLLLGFFLIILCFLNVRLLNSSGAFPYFGASDAVSVGNVFSRISGFSYFLFFSACIVSVGTALCAFKAAFRIFEKKQAMIALIIFLGIISSAI